MTQLHAPPILSSLSASGGVITSLAPQLQWLGIRSPSSSVIAVPAGYSLDPPEFPGVTRIAAELIARKVNGVTPIVLPSGTLFRIESTEPAQLLGRERAFLSVLDSLCKAKHPNDLIRAAGADWPSAIALCLNKAVQRQDTVFEHLSDLDREALSLYCGSSMENQITGRSLGLARDPSAFYTCLSDSLQRFSGPVSIAHQGVGDLPLSLPTSLSSKVAEPMRPTMTPVTRFIDSDTDAAFSIVLPLPQGPSGRAAGELLSHVLGRASSFSVGGPGKGILSPFSQLPAMAPEIHELGAQVVELSPTQSVLFLSGITAPGCAGSSLMISLAQLGSTLQELAKGTCPILESARLRLVTQLSVTLDDSTISTALAALAPFKGMSGPDYAIRQMFNVTNADFQAISRLWGDPGLCAVLILRDSPLSERPNSSEAVQLLSSIAYLNDSPQCVFKLFHTIVIP